MALLDQVIKFLVSGGPAMWPLSISAFALWYAIGHRWFLLKRETSKRPRELFDAIQNKEKVAQTDTVVAASFEALTVLRIVPPNEDFSPYVNEAFDRAEHKLSKFRGVIVTMVTIAPLLGLLGTVMGMIEAFDAITNSTSGDTTTGIASGIAKALYATQFGLVIAIPGMMFGSILSRKEKRVVADLRQMKGLISLSVASKILGEELK